MGHSRTPTQNTAGDGFPADPIDGSGISENCPWECRTRRSPALPSFLSPERCELRHPKGNRIATKRTVSDVWPGYEMGKYQSPQCQGRRAMFHRHHSAEVSVVAVPRVRTVRLLETDEDLRTAVERARAFEQRGAAPGVRRALSYERYLDGKRADLADVIQMDSDATVSA
jgi:hypothetical protein